MEHTTPVIIIHTIYTILLLVLAPSVPGFTNLLPTAVPFQYINAEQKQILHIHQSLASNLCGSHSLASTSYLILVENPHGREGGMLFPPPEATLAGVY